MSMAEIVAVVETDLPMDREQAINATTMPAGIARMLSGAGVQTVGALLDTDAFKAITSGRYDIEKVREVNGIPIAALRWLIDEITLRCGDSKAAAVI